MFVFLVGISALLHFLWESAHVGLYTGYAHLTELPITVYATVGDVLYTLGAVGLVSIFKKGVAWLMRPTMAEYLGLVCVGFMIALFVEYKGLFLGRWTYLTDMPIIPGFGVGVSPVLQMTILLPLSVALTSLCIRFFFPKYTDNHAG